MTIIVCSPRYLMADKACSFSDDFSIDTSKLCLLKDGVVSCAGSASILSLLSDHLSPITKDMFSHLTVTEFVELAFQKLSDITKHKDLVSSNTSLVIKNNVSALPWGEAIQLQVRSTGLTRVDFSEVIGSASSTMNYAFDAWHGSNFRPSGESDKYNVLSFAPYARQALLAWIAESSLVPFSSGLDNQFEVYSCEERKILLVSFDFAVVLLANAMIATRGRSARLLNRKEAIDKMYAATKGSSGTRLSGLNLELVADALDDKFDILATDGLVS